MDSALIQKYSKYSIAELKKKAQIEFNKFIRERDRHLPCISCPKGKVEQASHFYSAGHYSAMRFNEDNCHGSCIRCNYFLSGNLIEYRKGLEARIGKDKVKELDQLAEQSKRNRAFKFDRFTLIEILTTYKNKSKELIK